MSGNAAPPTAGPLGDIHTERLELRRFAETDLDALAAVFAKPEVWQYPYGRGFTRDESEAFLDQQLTEWNEYGFGCWLALERGTGHVVGYIGLSVPTFLPEILPAVEVGWRLDPDYWGQGLATEGAGAAIQEGFDVLGLDEIVSVPQADNPRSVEVCRRLGMHHDRDVTINPNDRRGALRASLFSLTDEARSVQ